MSGLVPQPYSWPSCTVWVPVETAAVLAAPLEPIDVDAVRVHRVRERRTPPMPKLRPDLLRPVDFGGLNLQLDLVSPSIQGHLQRAVNDLSAQLPDMLSAPVVPVPGTVQARLVDQRNAMRALGYDVDPVE